MVTFLDLGLLEYFSVIFPALLIFAIVFAILTLTKVLGENKLIIALVSLALGFMALLSEDVVAIINYMSPWFVLVLVFVILLILIYRTLGATEKDVGDFIRTDKPVKWIIFAVGAVIFLVALGTVLGERIGPYLGDQPDANVTTEDIQSGVATGSWSQNVGATLFHPKILGVLLIVLIAAFTIAILGMKPD